MLFFCENVFIFFAKWHDTITSSSSVTRNDKEQNDVSALFKSCLLIRLEFLKVFLQTLVFNGPSPASFSFFQTNITILQQINVKKCPPSIRCWDSNPRPPEHESPPITTRTRAPQTIVVVVGAKMSGFDRERNLKAKSRPGYLKLKLP